MDITKSEYHLFEQCISHSEDVRCVVSMPDNCFATGSRDRTIKVWKPNNLNNTYEVSKVLSGHSHFVGCLIYLDPMRIDVTKTNISDVLISGSNDKKIIIWDYSSESAISILEGHEAALTCLEFNYSSGYLFSGSIDSTIRVWSGNNCIRVLTGHSAPVWSIATVNNDLYSASADKTICKWNVENGEYFSFSSVHKDSVRSIIQIKFILPIVSLASASNDATIKIWSSNGDLQNTLYGHNSFIYSIIENILSGELISCSETGEVKVWKNGKCIETIKCPGTVWDITVLDNGDIVTASSDGIARIWSRNPNRIASADVLEVYDEIIKEKDLNEGIDVNSLPGLEALAQPGTEGQVIMVANGAIAEVYSFNGEKNSWEKIGEAMGKVPKAQNEGVIDGKHYDHVIDVDMEDGIPRKIGMNDGDNSYQVAQDFIWKHDISQNHLQSIVDFLDKNVKPVVIGERQQMIEGNRYVPGDVPARSSQSQSHIKNTLQGSLNVKSYHFPVTSYVTFSFANQNAASKTTNLIYHKLVGTFSELEKLGLTVNKKEDILEDLLTNILSKIAYYHSNEIYKNQYEYIYELVDTWPREKLFPLLDLFRIMVVHPSFKNLVTTDLISFIISKSLNGITSEKDISGSPKNNILILFRFLTNAFSCPSLIESLLFHVEKILFISECIYSINDAINLSVASLLLNFSIVLSDRYSDIPNIETILKQYFLLVSKISKDISNKPEKLESVYRLFAGTGTILSKNSLTLSFAKSTDLQKAFELYCNSIHSEKVKILSSQLISFLKQ